MSSDYIAHYNDSYGQQIHICYVCRKQFYSHNVTDMLVLKRYRTGNKVVRGSSLVSHYQEDIVFHTSCFEQVAGKEYILTVGEKNGKA